MIGLFYIVLFLLSLSLYLISPKEYSHSFCTCILLLYLLASSVYILKFYKREKNLFCFHFFFFISMFFVNFVYPVFLYPISRSPFFMFNLPFDDNLINKGTALVLLGMMSYILGCNVIDKVKLKDNRYFSLNFNSILLFSMNTFTLFISLFVSIYIYKNFAGSDVVDVESKGLFFVRIFIVLTCFFNTAMNRDLVKKNVLKFIKKNMYVLLSSCFVIFSCIHVGDRGPALFILISLMGIFVTFVSKIKIRYILLLAIIGFFTMNYIAFSRDSNKSARSTYINSLNLSENMWTPAMDLIINNRNLYAGIEYADENGFLFGKGYLPTLFSPIPFGPSIVSLLFFNEFPTQMTTAYLLTEYSNVTDFGVGSNLIVDIYMNFSFPGVIILLFLLGLFLNYNIRCSDVYPLSSLITIFMFYYSIYLPRSTYDSFVQLLIFAIILYLLNTSVFKIRLLRNSFKL